MGKCIAALSSVTYALKGREVLNGYSIGSGVIKLDPSMTENGCAYGLEFNCAQLDNVKRIMEKHSVEVREYVGSER